MRLRLCLRVSGLFYVGSSFEAACMWSVFVSMCMCLCLCQYACVCVISLGSSLSECGVCDGVCDRTGVSVCSVSVFVCPSQCLCQCLWPRMCLC
jgi:hypothetical protein